MFVRTHCNLDENLIASIDSGGDNNGRRERLAVKRK